MLEREAAAGDSDAAVSAVIPPKNKDKALAGGAVPMPDFTKDSAVISSGKRTSNAQSGVRWRAFRVLVPVPDARWNLTAELMMESMSVPSSNCLVADIGGTNARFALASRTAGGLTQLADVQLLDVASHPTIADAVRSYLAAVTPARMPEVGVFAVASPVTGDTIRLTNSHWLFSVDAVRKELGLRELVLINDFSALSRSIPHLDAAQLKQLGDPRLASVDKHRSYAILGPGTGLGVGGLLLRDGNPIVIESEGGHMAFAPDDTLEIEVLRLMKTRFDRVSCERLISGNGLLHLYESICMIEGQAVAHTAPSQITRAAELDAGGIEARVVERFCAILGGIAGDVAMCLGAWDGVYLGGGISARLLTWLQKPGFRQRFESKGRHRTLMASIPTLVIEHPHAGLIGAAACARDLTSS